MGPPNNKAAGLTGSSEEDRRAAVLALKDKPDGFGLRLLEKALGDESWRVRKAAVEVISSYPDAAEVSRSLIHALEDEDNAGRRNAAVEALVSMGGSAVSFLVDRLDHSDDDVRKFIIDILAEIKDPTTIEHILPLTRDGQENIRLAAVEAIGSIGGDKAFNSLLSLLNSEDISLQFGVLHALSRLGKPIPVDTMKPLLDKKILKRAIYDALGNTRSLEAVEIVADGLLDPAKSPKQAAVRAIHKLAGDKSLRETVEKSVRKRLAKKPLDDFSEMMEGGLGLKKAAISVLSMTGAKDALKILSDAAHDDSVQVEIEEAIARISKKASGAIEEPVPERPAARPAAVLLKKPAEAPLQALGPMANEQFQKVRDLVSEEAGLYYDNELKYLVERRVQRRMEAAGIGTYEAYIYLITGEGEKSSDERRELISILSTNETYFFREEFQLKAFKEEILPALIRTKQGKPRPVLRIWSAGCSSGEEPYTIAMLIKETPELEGFGVEIVGSDINDRMLDYAREAIYTQSSFRSIPDTFKDKYFQPEGARHRLRAEIRTMVTFDDNNLMFEDSGFGHRNFDVIFCRNVIIYFSPEAKRRVVDRFYNSLVPGGYLLLGHSESLMSISTQFELVHLKHDLVYRKPAGGRGQ